VLQDVRIQARVPTLELTAKYLEDSATGRVLVGAQRA